MNYQRLPLLLGFRESVGLRDTYGGIDGVVALQAHHLKPDVPSDTIVIFMHPMGIMHYLPLPPALAAAGVHVLTAVSRYPNNDSALIMEKVVIDLGKWVDQDRLAATIDRVRQRLSEKRSSEESERLKEILNEVAPDSIPDDMAADSDAHAANRYERVLNIKDRGQIFRVDVGDIERIDAAGDYMCIYTADQTLILRETMKDLEKRLDPRKFQRIHRSTIVNLDNIKSVKPHTNGECFLVLGSNTQVKVSRSYREVVARFL